MCFLLHHISLNGVLFINQQKLFQIFCASPTLEFKQKKLISTESEVDLVTGEEDKYTGFATFHGLPIISDR